MLTLFELERLGLRGAIERRAADTLREAIPALCRLQWLDEIEALSQAASIGHGTGLPAVDALILTSLLRAGATVVYTTDEDFERYKKSGIEVVNLKKIKD